MKKNLLSLITLMILLPSLYISAQDIRNSITGVALEENGEPLLYANILLLTSADSTLTKAELTDETGKYVFKNIAAGSYVIKISYVGLPEYMSKAFSISANEQKNIEVIKMAAASTELEEVLVTAERRMIEVRPDKIVFNVENSIGAAGSNALELMRKSPGVVLDNNENITLLGKSGVRIYINDRPARLSGTDLANYLRTLNASDIDNIEIITNPSAKYEAEGNAGIINIKLKKNQNFGTNGSVTGNYGNGVVENWNGQLRLNHRKNFYNIFGSYSYNDDANFNFEELRSEQIGVFFDQRSDQFNNWSGHNYRFGSDFFINKNHTLGFILSGNDGITDGSRLSNTKIGNLVTSTLVDSVLIAETIEDGSNDRFDANINYQIKGENDLFLNFDFNYGTYNNEQTNEYRNFNTTPELMGQRNNSLNNDAQATGIDIYTARFDYEKNVGIGKLGAGLKTSIVNTDNDFEFNNVINGVSIQDFGRSSEFSYNEIVNAAYAAYDWKKDKWTFNAGLRFEASDTEGTLFQMDGDSIVSRQYVDLFPSAGASYQINPLNAVGIAFSRRIDRPNYQNLNPFVYFINERTISTGDPFLEPQRTTNLQVSHTYKYAFNTVLKYSRTEDLMTRFSEASEIEGDLPGEPSGEKFFWDNLDKQETLSLNFSAPFTIKEWWSTFVSITTSVISNQGTFGTGTNVDIVRPSLNIYGQNTFQLPKDFSFEISGWYGAGGVWGGNFETGAMGQLSAGLQKKLFNNKGSLKINFTDIFLTSQWQANVDSGILTVSGFGGWDSRRLLVSYTHSFGNQKIKSRNRKTGSEDENKRISE
jgi:hypothetical protein